MLLQSEVIDLYNTYKVGDTVLHKDCLGKIVYIDIGVRTTYFLLDFLDISKRYYAAWHGKMNL